MIQCEFLWYFLLIVGVEKGADFTVCTEIDNLIVDTAQGKIQGRILRTIQEPHRSYYAFRGIPYAKPPIGKLRFQPPLKPDSHEGVLKCEEYGNTCPQVSPKNGTVIGSEDCLTLNVYTTNLNPAELRPVMFWIHGGAHIEGSSQQNEPDYLIEEPIVFVSVNYRLNIFGYLTVMDENAYGNIAIKDQLAALEWVKDNIANFGGDPSRVTIFGESSGCNSVSLLQLTPRARGLFHQMIGESGSALNARYLQRNPLKYVYNVARYFNVSTESTKSLVEGLQEINWVELTKAGNSTEATGYHTSLETLPFVPVIEAKHEGAIITEAPYKLLESGNFNKVPFIFGYNTNEGVLGLKTIKAGMIVSDYDENYSLYVSNSFNDPPDAAKIGKIIRDRYIGDGKIDAGNPTGLLRFFTQDIFVRAMRKALDFQRKHTAGFFYRFSYKGSHTSPYPGVAHAEELQYIFVKEGMTDNLTEGDVLTRKRMVKMWTNFAIYGSPTPEPEKAVLLRNVTWPKSTADEVHFLDIGSDLVPGTSPDEEEYQFWREMFEKYAVEPFVTY